MGSVFWDAKRILMLDYLQTGQTTMGQYYANLLDQLQHKIHAERLALARKKVLFHKVNAHPYTCVVTMAKIYKLDYKLFPHPSYAPDMAPSVFPMLKIFLDEWRFS